jgi:hypothetical protein
MDYVDTILQKYDEEFEMDVTQNILNLSEVVYRHPNTQHKWIHRLRQHQRQIIILNRKVEEYIKNSANSLRQEYPKISEVKLKSSISNNEEYIESKRQIEDEKMIVDHLEQYIKILQQMGYNFKISTEHIKMDLTSE